MNRNKVRDTVLEIINEKFNREDCFEDTKLRSEWGATSIDEMEYILDIEEEFGMELFDQIKTVHIETPQQIIDLIMDKQG